MHTSAPAHTTGQKQDSGIEFEGLFPSSTLLTRRAGEEHCQAGLRIRTGLDRSAPGTPSNEEWKQKARDWLAESEVFSPKERRSAKEGQKGYDALLDVYRTPPYDLPKAAYLELCLVVAGLAEGAASCRIPSEPIYDQLSGEAEDEVRRIGGVTEVKNVPSVLISKREKFTTTLYELGTLLIEAWAEYRRLPSDASETAGAIEEMCSTGDPSPLARLSQNGLPKDTLSKSKANTNQAEPKRKTENPKRETSNGTAQPPGRNREARPRRQGHGRPGHGNPRPEPRAEATDGAPAEPAGRAVEVNTLLGEGAHVLSTDPLFAPAQEEFPLPTRRLEEAQLLDPSRTACGEKRRDPGNRDPRNRSGLEVLASEEIEALRKRTPRCSYLPIPTELYDRITDWRPVLSESEPLAALLQHVLFGMGRDESWQFEQDCTGIPVPNSKLFAMFDYSSRQSGCSNAGLNSGMLLDLYREEVDEDFRVSGWNGKEGKARVVRAHGLPEGIVHKSKEVMLSPQDYDDWTLLVNGRSANRRSYTKSLRAERREKIQDQEPAIEPPGFVRRTQRYLNGLPQGRFGHSGYGIFKPAKAQAAIRTAKREYPRELRRDEELRKLFWLRTYPQPLYKVCGRFPRLKADRPNQAMNLPSTILRSTYTKKDVELDLTKAHLACMVPLAEQEGIDASLLCEYLRRSMEGKDLWSELTDSFSSEFDWDPAAARTAAKKIYALVYGSSLNNLFREMTMLYGKKTGEYRSFDAFRPVTSHELVDDLLRIRSKLRSVINRGGGMTDAAGRFIPLSKWEGTKNKEDRWRGVLAYVNASYEQKLMSEAFRIAEEESRRERPRFWIWLYQADGFTMRVASKYKPANQIELLQSAVDSKAEELGVPTRLEVEYPNQYSGKR